MAGSDHDRSGEHEVEHQERHLVDGDQRLHVVGRPRTAEPAEKQALLRAYSDGDREKLAVDVLRRILETDKRTLRDLRKVANLGADVVDNLKKYFEIKSAAGDMPDVVSLQYSELERSLERPAGHWFLVVVSGLEQGYETSVRFIADPLRHLTWADHGSVSLSGVRTARAVEIRLPAAPAAND